MGHNHVKLALLIAAAGNHNVLMIGPSTTIAVNPT